MVMTIGESRTAQGTIGQPIHPGAVIRCRWSVGSRGFIVAELSVRSLAHQRLEANVVTRVVGDESFIAVKQLAILLSSGLAASTLASWALWPLTNYKLGALSLEEADREQALAAPLLRGLVTMVAREVAWDRPGRYALRLEAAPEGGGPPVRGALPLEILPMPG